MSATIIWQSLAAVERSMLSAERLILGLAQNQHIHPPLYTCPHRGTDTVIGLRLFDAWAVVSTRTVLVSAWTAWAARFVSMSVLAGQRL